MSYVQGGRVYKAKATRDIYSKQNYYTKNQIENSLNNLNVLAHLAAHKLSSHDFNFGFNVNRHKEH